jgi:hypothetical protein
MSSSFDSLGPFSVEMLHKVSDVYHLEALCLEYGAEENTIAALVLKEDAFRALVTLPFEIEILLKALPSHTEAIAALVLREDIFFSLVTDVYGVGMLTTALPSYAEAIAALVLNEDAFYRLTTNLDSVTTLAIAFPQHAKTIAALSLRPERFCVLAANDNFQALERFKKSLPEHVEAITALVLTPEIFAILMRIPYDVERLVKALPERKSAIAELVLMPEISIKLVTDSYNAMILSQALPEYRSDISAELSKNGAVLAKPYSEERMAIEMAPSVSDEASIRSITIEKNSPEVIDLMMKRILLSSILPEFKALLLQANACKPLGLEVAIQLGFFEKALIYINNILNSDLTPDVQKKLLPYLSPYNTTDTVYSKFPPARLRQYRTTVHSTRNNGRFKDAKGDLIVCRHLAPAFLRLKKKKEYVKVFSSQSEMNSDKKLRENWDDNEKIEGRGDRYLHVSLAETSPDRMGEVLARELSHLSPGQEENFLFVSEIHVMSLVIKKKEKEGVCYFSILFYDPRVTLNHQRFVLSNLDQVRELTIRDFVSVEDESCYFPVYKSGVLILYRNPELLSSDSGVIPIEFHGEDSPPLFLLMLTGRTEQTNQAMKSILNVLDMPEVKVKRLLAERGSSWPGPALHSALFYGYENTVRCYVQNILESELGPDIQEAILGSIAYRSGKPALSIAFERNHIETIQIYVECILNSELPLMNKKNLILMMCKGEPCLLGVLEAGSDETSKAFFASILSSRIEPDVRNALLIEILVDLKKALSDDSSRETLQRLKDIITETLGNHVLRELVETCRELSFLLPPVFAGSAALVIAASFDGDKSEAEKPGGSFEP